MVTARSAKKAYLAIILTVAALVFPKNTWAASGNVQVCNPGSSCKIGEFLYDDSYNPITNATCNITSRYPDGTILLNSVAMTSAPELDGWYSYTLTAPTTIGVYRTQIKCTTTDSQTLALDKSFEIQTPPVTSAPSANDVAGAVWGYSGRSLTTFGSLVSDIWGSAARTLTGATLSSGSLATKNDVDSVKNTTTETRSLLEQVVNKPIVQNILEDGSTPTINLQTKLEKSDSLANQLLTSGNYLKSKTSLLKIRRDNIGEQETAKSLDQIASLIGEEKDTTDKNSIFGQLNWLAEQWNLPVSSKLASQNKKIYASIKSLNAKSPPKTQTLLADIDNFIKLVGTKNDTPKSNTLFGQLQGKKELSSALDKNYIAATALLPNFGKDSKPSTDQIAQINVLGAQIAAINQIPKMDKVILSQSSAKMDSKQLKNKALSLRGIVEANRQLLAQGINLPLKSLWLEEGSIIFKTLIINPSRLISQKVPLKYYLPKEVTKESVTKTDEGVTINYDPEKGQYYISGDFTLAPEETKTLSVTVDDSAFHINDGEIARVRKQAEELSKPLEHTSYFAQGVTLKSDIDASLDKVETAQKDNITPEAKIKNYREAQIEFKAAEGKLEKLKELTTSAGSAGNLFGFVGGAQAIAVWGLIIIMVAGFVFLALYMRTLRNSEKYSQLEQQKLPPIQDEFENYEEVPNEEKPQNTPKKRFQLGKPLKYMAVLLVSILIGSSSIYALATLRPGGQKVIPTPPQTVLGSSSEKSASESSRLDPASYEQSSSSNKEVNILVPEDSTVTVHPESSINSPVLTSLNASKKAQEVSRQDGWVKVILQDKDGKNIEGWVDQDFIAQSPGSGAIQVPDSMQKNSTVSAQLKPQGSIQPNLNTVVINDTPVGFLRVRKTPGGEEITKLNPGEQFPIVQEESGWIQIVLEEGTAGWVSKQYVNF